MSVTNINKNALLDIFTINKNKLSNKAIKIHIIIFIAVLFPIIKISFEETMLPIVVWLGLILLSYIFIFPSKISIWNRYRNRIHGFSSEHFFLKNCKTTIVNNAIKFLDIDANDVGNNYIIIPYPVFKKTKKIKNRFILRFENMNDKKQTEYYNYSFWNIQILFIQKKRISCYFCSYNLITDKVINEHSNHFAYNELSNLKTESKKVRCYTKWTKEPITTIKVTKLYKKTGETFQIISSIPELKQPPQTIVSPEKLEKTITHILNNAKNNMSINNTNSH